jgi:hypothetical protein
VLVGSDYQVVPKPASSKLNDVFLIQFLCSPLLEYGGSAGVPACMQIKSHPTEVGGCFQVQPTEKRIIGILESHQRKLVDRSRRAY